MTHPSFSFTAESVGIIGVGLLGGSIAAALQDRRPGVRVVGVGRDPERLEAACRAGLLQDATTKADEVARNCSLVVVCTPVDRVATDVLRILATCGPETLVTDVGSVKQPICAQVAADAAGEGLFIGSHPLAGSEKTGFENARSDLFDGACCIICPDSNTPALQTARLRGFWELLGAQVTEMSSTDHDQLVAAISHVPHAVAAALALVPTDEELPFSGTGFRDSTRIAGGDPALWTPILLSNREAVLNALARFESSVGELRTALEGGESAIRDYLNRARSQRQRLQTNPVRGESDRRS